MSLQQLYSVMIGLVILGFLAYFHLDLPHRKTQSQGFETQVASMNRLVDVGVLSLWEKIQSDVSLIEETLRTESLMGALDIDMDEFKQKHLRLEKASLMCQESLDIECRQKAIEQLLSMDESIQKIGEKTKNLELQDRALAHQLSSYQEKLENIRERQERLKAIQERHREKAEQMRDKNERAIERNRSKMDSWREKNEAQKDKMQALRDRMERMKKY